MNRTTSQWIVGHRRSGCSLEMSFSWMRKSSVTSFLPVLEKSEMNCPRYIIDINVSVWSKLPLLNLLFGIRKVDWVSGLFLIVSMFHTSKLAIPQLQRRMFMWIQAPACKMCHLSKLGILKQLLWSEFNSCSFQFCRVFLMKSPRWNAIRCMHVPIRVILFPTETSKMCLLVWRKTLTDLNIKI